MRQRGANVPARVGASKHGGDCGGAATPRPLGRLAQGWAPVSQPRRHGFFAALATPAQVNAMAAVPGVQGIYLNRPLTYYGHAGSGLWLLHESIPTIRADAVQASGITGKGMGIAILDSGIDGLYNPDLHYPDHTVQNIKVIFN